MSSLWGRRAVVVLFLAALSLLVLATPALAAVSDAPDSTPQTDGVVFSVLPVGDRIYIGGDFAHVDGVPRKRLAAIDAATGRLTDWDPGASSKVFSLAASPDGSRIYVGGDFTSVGGTTRNRLAAVNASTGAVEAAFNAGQMNQAVRSIAVWGNRVYVGGNFTTAQGQSRTRLALVDGVTGALNPGWAPTANNRVRTLGASPDGSRIYAGGDFTAVSGQSRLRLAALDSANNGTLLPWRTLVSPNGPVIDLAVSGGRVYAAEGGPGGAAAAYEANTGARAWQLRGDGNGQAITVMGTKAYIGGHYTNFAGQRRVFFAAADAATGTLDLQWNPSGGGGKLSDAYTTGVWDLVPDKPRGRLYAGTNFRKVNGQPHAGFVQFSDTSVSPTDGARKVRPAAEVGAFFSGAMDPSMLDGATFTLTRKGDSKRVAAMVGDDGISDKAVLKPSSKLEPGQAYMARITTRARDVAGNALAGDRVWSFTTVASRKNQKG